MSDRKIDLAQEQATKPNFQSVLGQGFEANIPSGQRGTEEEVLVIDFDCSFGANSSSAHLWIVQFIRCAFIFSLRRAIELPWTTHPKGFVRPLVVKCLPPQIEAPLIGLPQGFNLPANVAMQPLVRSVVLRMPWPASLQINSQGHPPSRQPAQSKKRIDTGKRRSVITAHCLRQSRSLKHSLESTFARHSSMPTQIQFPDLARSPTHMRQL